MSIDYASLYNILPYVRLFRHKIFVVKLSGELCEKATTLSHIILQLALLKSVGIQLVVIHGGGKHATQLGDTLNISSEFIAGRRITSAAMIEVVKMSFAGKLNTEIIAQFKKQGIAAVGLSGIDGNLISAVKRPPLAVHDSQQGAITVDYGYVADINSVDITLLQLLLQSDYIPVICSLTADDEGQILNVNADTLATQIAIYLQAEKLCLLSNVEGVMRDINDANSMLSLLSIQQTQQLLQDKSISDGMIPKLNNAIAALEGGVHGVHIINGNKADVMLQEIFTNEGAGTMIVPTSP